MARRIGSKQVSEERKMCIWHEMCWNKSNGHCNFYGMPQPTISNIIKRFKLQNSKGQKRKHVLKFKLSARPLRMFQKYVTSYRFDPLFVIVTKFSSATGTSMHTSSDRRYIKRLHLYLYVAAQKPFRTTRHLIACLKWARKHERWTDMHWINVLFTDESSFTVRPSKNRLRVWRHPGSRWTQQCTVLTFKSGNQSISV